MMVAKTSKKSFLGYGGLWSTEKEHELTLTENVQEANEQAEKSEQVDQDMPNVRDNICVQDAPNKFNNIYDTSNNDVLDVQVKKRGRGRPKMDDGEKKEHFNLLLKPEVRITLTKIAGRIQAETGQRFTVTGLITQLVEDFIAKQKQGDF